MGKVTAYSCSGCSSVAQLANDLCKTLDRTRQVEMSCIAGVGGKVPALVVKARQAERILCLDGCPLKCAYHCLKEIDLEPDVHMVLTEQGVKKIQHGEYHPADFARIRQDIQNQLKELD